MRRGLGLERQRGRQREADDDPGGDDQQPPGLGARGPWSTPGGEHGDGQQGGDGGAAEGDEPRVEPAVDGDAGRGQGEREGHDAERSEEQPLRFSTGRSSVTVISHAQR
nr:hypothetical protein [Conexibacter sp. W3-3-2]